MANMVYTVTQDDLAITNPGLAAITLKLGLAKKGPGNTLNDWMPVLKVAEQIAKANGMRWDGPPNWTTTPIKVGMKLVIPASLASPAPPIMETTGGGKLSTAKKIALGALVVGSLIGIAYAVKGKQASYAGYSGYKVFKRSATNWEEMSNARKTTIARGLTEDEARRMCRDFNNNRTPTQVRKGTKLEYTEE